MQAGKISRKGSIVLECYLEFRPESHASSQNEQSRKGSKVLEYCIECRPEIHDEKEPGCETGRQLILIAQKLTQNAMLDPKPAPCISALASC